MFALLLMSDAISITISVVSLFVGAVLGQVVNVLYQKHKQKKIKERNAKSLARLPHYNPIDDDVIVLRQWNAVDVLNEKKERITYNDEKVCDSIMPEINCPYISEPLEWKKMYSEALLKEHKKTGLVSYVTKLILDHKDTHKGDCLEIEVSTCDYMAHHVNSLYLTKHPNDWNTIKQTLINGNLDDYFSHAMPSNVFVNYIIINGQTNNVLAIKRSNQELNARNIWGLTGFETMSNIANAANGSEERKLRSIVYRALREELAVEEEEVSQMAISAISFVKHLGIMVTALVRVDLEGENENTVSEETTQAEDEKHTVNTLDEGMFIERILRLSESSYEHSNFKWIPIVLPEMKKYIEENSGFYTETIQEQDGKDSKWISYAKLQMYEIWRNYNSINIQL